MAVDYINITIQDRAGNQTAFYQSPSQLNPDGSSWAVVGGSFDIKANEGCGTFELKIDKAGINGTVACGYQITVDVVTRAGATVRYWKGVIKKIQKPGSTGRVWTYLARGLWDEVEAQKTINYYTGANIDDVVADILSDIDTPSTLISASTSEIVIASPYAVADIESEFDTTGEIIAQLATMQVDVQYGVDQNGKLYFKDLDTSDVKTFVVGGQYLSALDVNDDIEQTFNDVYLQSKDMVGSGQLTLHDSDATSITAYGRRTKVVQIRNTKNANDGIQYLAAVLTRDKNPKQHVKSDLVGFDDFIFPRGKVRIIDVDGTEYHFPIQRVKYELDPTGGLTGSLELGDLPAPRLDEQLRQIVRQVERGGSNSMSLTKIEHTRGEEFAQAALVDARKNGKLNIFQDFIDDLKAFDPTLSTFGSQALYDRSIVGPFGYLQNIAISNVIKTGQSPDHVRLHTYVNNAGRINFDSDSDISMFFDAASGVGDWRVDENGHAAEQFQGGGTAFLSYRIGGAGSKGTPWHHPANATPRFKVRIKALTNVAGRDARVYFGAQNALTNNFNYVSLSFGGGTFNAFFVKDVSGTTTSLVATSLAFVNGMSVDDEIVVSVVYDGGGNYHIDLIDGTDETTILSTGGSVALSVPANARQLINQFWNATDGKVLQLLWYQPQNDLGANTVAVISRDDGVTWSSAIPLGNTADIEHQDVDLSGQPSGARLRVQFGNEHPGRILGWAVSW